MILYKTQCITAFCLSVSFSFAMITENILWIIIALLVVWLVKLWWKYRSFFQLAAKIPQIEGGLPLLGYAHKFIGADNKGVKVYEPSTKV